MATPSDPITLTNSINEAMSLLDPPPATPSSKNQFSIENVARAYDILLHAATNMSCINRQTLANNDGIDATSSIRDLTTTADLYRALLVSCHLLIEMAPAPPPRRRITCGHDFWNGLHLPYLDGTDKTTLRRTAKRCILLLRALDNFVLPCRGNDILPNNSDNPNQNSNLPSSKFELLRVCFEGSSPIVSLDWDSLAEDDEEDPNRYELDRTTFEEAEEERHVIDINERELEQEEQLLLDIAFPDTAVASNGRRVGPLHHGSEFNGDLLQNPHESILEQDENDVFDDTTEQQPAITFDNRETILMEGWLIRHHLPPPSTDNDDTADPNQRHRHYCRLYTCGIFLLSPSPQPITLLTPQLICHWFIIPSFDISCHLVPNGNTFHFQINGLYQLLSSPNDSTSPTVNLLLEVDEMSGGGLKEGFSWVTQINRIIQKVAVKDEIQSQIRKEWEEVWNRAAAASSSLQLVTFGMRDNKKVLGIEEALKCLHLETNR